MNLKHFQLSEFDSPDQPGSGVEMKSSFLIKIDRARGIAGIPFSINSGFRTEGHNKSVGGKIDSSHLKGMAADIAVEGSRERYMIMIACLKAGFTRIGIADGFIHVDNDPDKPSKLIWNY